MRRLDARVTRSCTCTCTCTCKALCKCNVQRVTCGLRRYCTPLSECSSADCPCNAPALAPPFDPLVDDYLADLGAWKKLASSYSELTGCCSYAAYVHANRECGGEGDRGCAICAPVFAAYRALDISGGKLQWDAAFGCFVFVEQSWRFSLGRQPPPPAVMAARMAAAAANHPCPPRWRFALPPSNQAGPAPLFIGIDGEMRAGKTSLAQGLERQLRLDGLETVRLGNVSFDVDIFQRGLGGQMPWYAREHCSGYRPDVVIVDSTDLHDQFTPPLFLIDGAGRFNLKLWLSLSEESCRGSRF